MSFVDSFPRLWVPQVTVACARNPAIISFVDGFPRRGGGWFRAGA